jgi:tRNA-2-methylthio-N6-dimethylallyladenosine synthase
MENQVPDDVKHERFQRLLDTLYPIGLEKNEKLIGEIVEVLVEDVSKNNDKILNGRTRSSKLVHFPGDKELIGKLINVRIDEVKTFTLEGTIV